MFNNFLKEFRNFAMRGNMVDMAVGIIIGAAFSKVVSSLVSDIMMPPLGYLLGRVDFSSLVFTLHEKTADTPAVTINYGLFLNSMLDFIIVAFAIFIIIKQMNRLMPKKVESVTTKACPYCYSNISQQASRCPQCTSNL